MNVLIVGGAGYIGSHIVRELVKKGESVTVADNLATGFAEAVDKAAKLYVGDIRDTDFLDRVFSENKFDAVMHFAANSLVGESVKEPLRYYENNMGGAMSLLSAMQKFGVNKIIFSSTAAVYGDAGSDNITEETRTQPTNPYGETKLSMEKLFYWVSRASDMRYVSLRYFNACGADESGELGEAHNPETHLIPRVLKAGIAGEAVSVFGTDYETRDGTCVRDYIHVTDLAQAHILALSYLMDGGESDIFNLGNGNGFTVSEIISASERVIGKEILKTYGERRPGDPPYLVASGEKAKKILGWKPQFTDVEKIIETAYKWHKSHPNGYEK